MPPKITSTAPVVRVLGDTVVFVGALGADILFNDLHGGERSVLNMPGGPGSEPMAQAVPAIRSFLENLTAERRPFWASLDLIREHGLPERRPYFDRLVGTRTRVLWVRRVEDWGSETRRWDVVRLDGRHFGTVVLPSGEDVLAVNDTRVATLSRDEYGAAVVAEYENPFPVGSR